MRAFRVIFKSNTCGLWSLFGMGGAQRVFAGQISFQNIMQKIVKDPPTALLLDSRVYKKR